ncbi:MAG: HepT-like ribonuclease domain-containing protein [Candidatus Margulisiibacteriota bacterium]|jgi:uncharacterized protein with HEPN domain
MPDKDLCNLKGCLEALNKALAFTASYANAEEFYQDPKGFDATMMNFVVMGEMVSRMSDEFMTEHANIPWSLIKAFRNIVAHDYFGIDADETWQIIKTELPKLKIQLEQLI